MRLEVYRQHGFFFAQLVKPWEKPKRPQPVHGTGQSVDEALINLTEQLPEAWWAIPMHGPLHHKD